LAKQAQDRIATAADAQVAAKICPCLTSADASQLAQRFLQPLGALSVRVTEIRKPFDKNLLHTGALFTEETTYMHDEANGTPNGRKIMQHPCIPTLDAR
jgi:hypothetical protein